MVIISRSNKLFPNQPLINREIKYLPGPSNNHSSPAIRLTFPSSKSETARNLSAEFGRTTGRGLTISFKASPGYNGKGSWAKRYSSSPIRTLTCPYLSTTGTPSLSVITGFRITQYIIVGTTVSSSGPRTIFSSCWQTYVLGPTTSEVT
ncbi:unnamed protein product [Schistosoma mattheei]|uniref:Uncharacterized protein n=1 Tax=Schistosoma mattheei TaxID=31246 RepID=A0A183NPS5_9TREM|nr:unnamed protein product [Schistosoma mattheei]